MRKITSSHISLYSFDNLSNLRATGQVKLRFRNDILAQCYHYHQELGNTDPAIKTRQSIFSSGLDLLEN